jgi:hypothetical protein
MWSSERAGEMGQHMHRMALKCAQNSGTVVTMLVQPRRRKGTSKCARYAWHYFSLPDAVFLTSL